MKNIVSVLLTAVILTSLYGCKDEEFTEKYLDPSTVTSVQVPNLFTGVLLRCRTYSYYGYNRYFGFDSGFTGKYAQTFGLSAASNLYSPRYANNVESQMSEFYYAMSDYVKMVDELQKMTQTEQEAFAAYRYGAMIQLYDWLTTVVDVFGDMPFSKACTLPLTSDINASYAPYDKAEDIYSTVLDELKTAGDIFSDPNLYKHNKFNQNDILNSGSYLKWQLYANSLRLRLAVRVSQFGPLVEKGRTVIREILESPDKYPLLENIEDSPFLKNDHSGDLNYRGGHGLGDDGGGSSGRLATAAMVDRMLSAGNWRKDAARTHIPGTGSYIPGVDDPRICLLYTMRRGNNQGGQSTNYSDIVRDPVMNDSLFYIGVDLAETFINPDYYGDVGTSQIIENGFFWNNENFEHVQITPSEVYFCRAEAYQRGWGVAKDEAKAKEYFKLGIATSIKMWYHWNDVNTGTATEVVKIPSDEVIDNFAEARWRASVNPAFPYGTLGDDHLEAILTQKWINFNIFFSRQAWSQIRRTGIPKLIFPDGESAELPWAPDRWRYPLTERSYNPYYPGADQDGYYKIIFWGDPRGMRHSVYSNGTWTDQWND
jgi:hypothetical protein